MANTLFIVESPNKCGKIRKYLGSGYTVKASVGHVREIPRKGLNIDIKNGFQPTFIISDGKKKVVKELKEAADKADEIILATDPDREGEAIAWSVYDLLPKRNQSKCTRITFDSITKKAIQDALKKKRDIDMALVDAQRARQVLDRLIGYKVSPILWRAIASGTSAGRVQSVALKFLVEREKEIQAFKPVDFWNIDALLQNNNGEFWARVVTKNKENRFLNEKKAEEVFNELKTDQYKVDKIEKAEKKRNAYPPFDTNSLQSACSSAFGWSLSKTSKIAQDLYSSGKITYIRTDSFNIAEEAMTAVRDLIKSSGGTTYLPSKPLLYKKKSKAAAQEAHECIRPADVNVKGEDLDGDEKKMYDMIRSRFIACQMKPMVVDTVTYHIITKKGHKLIAKGQTIKFDGWSKVYKYSQTKEELLPSVKEGEKLDLSDIKNTKHTTQPPPRYTEAKLSNKLEAEGVGRPSTWKTIIPALEKRTYVKYVQSGKTKVLTVTDLGIKVCDYLELIFSKFFMDVHYTASLEDDLDEIANGKKCFMDVVKSTYDYMMDTIKNSDAPMQKEKIDTGETCSVCKDGSIVEQDGKFGKFFSCNKYPQCKTIYTRDEDGKFAVKQKKTIKKIGKKCPECEKAGRDGELLERTNNRDGSKFAGCSKYPKCKFSESIE